MEYLTKEEENELIVGATFTIATVAGIIAIATVTVILYRLFKAANGKAKLPGGYAFEWK